MSSRRRRHVVTAAAAVGGVALFVWAIEQAGVAEVLGGIRRVGWGLVPILVLAGTRFVARAEAWRACMPAARRLTHGRALAAFIAGDALGNVTPLGLFASEPTKAYLIRDDLATRDAVSSLALDNLVYAASIVVMLTAGAIAVVTGARLAIEWTHVVAVSAVTLLAAALLLPRLLRGTWRPADGPRPLWRERLAAGRESVRALVSDPSIRLGRAAAWNLGFHALAVLEIFLTLRWLLGSESPTLVQAMGFEAMNRFITVVAKFVPFRVGVDEASSGALAPILAVQVTTGVTLAVVRKVRVLVWSAAGLLIIAARRFRAASATGRP